MHQGLKDEIRRIIFITFFALFIGLLSGEFLYCLLLAGFFYSCWLLHQTRKFYLWLEQNMDTPPPDSSGIWGDIIQTLYQIRQNNLKARDDLTHQLDRVQGFTEALPSGIVLINAMGQLSWWNDSAEKLLGLQKNYDLGKPILNLLRDPSFIRFYHHQNSNETLSMVSPINAEILLEIQIAQYGQNEKLLAVQNVTRLKKLEQIRKDFVANVSHELRTPLTVMNGYLEPIMDNLNEFSKEWQQPLTKVNEQSRRMTSLVSDLATLSHLDNSDVVDQRDPVSIFGKIRPIMDEIRTVHTNKTINLHLDGTDFIIQGSETELQSCLGNLVHNAAKYTQKDPVEINIHVWVDPHGGHVSIKDNGVGIDPKHFPRLTERFYRVESSHSRKTGGTGLGLAIVKHVLARHDGSLTIESYPGKGSTFTCHFPLHRLAHNQTGIAND